MRVRMKSFQSIVSITVIITVTGLFCLAAGRSFGATPDPTQQIRPVVEKVVAILTDPAMQGDDKCAKRRKMVMDVIQERFDFREMSKRVLGRQWRKLSDEEKVTFTGLFTTLLEHAYIGKIEDYSRQKVVFKGQRIKRNKAQVETVLIDANVAIPVSYIMILKNNEWKAYDIIVEGVSPIRNYMEQFKEIIRKDGYDSLVARMQTRIKELETGSGKPCPAEMSVTEKSEGAD